MGGNPVFCNHTGECFYVCISAAWKYANEDVSITLFTGHPIVDGQCVASPVTLKGVTGLSLASHRDFGDSGPLTVVIAKLCVQVRSCVFCVACFAVLGPQKDQSHPRLCQLLMHFCVVRNAPGTAVQLGREKRLLNHVICPFIWSWPHPSPWIFANRQTWLTVSRELRTLDAICLWL